jgi:nitric oxide reductase large subunit
MNKSINNKSKGSVALVIIILIVSLGLLGYFYFTKTKSSTTNQPVSTPITQEQPNANIVETADGSKKVTFSYSVKSISDSEIVINGKMGDMTLPNDSTKVQLFNGPTKDSPKLELSVLKVGDNVNVEFKSGGPVSLFLSTI